jgi:O-antigen/teichoic acid export membrane protein
MAGSGLKRLAGETAVYGLSSIIGRFVNWLLVPFYARVLDGTGEFGVYTNLYAWVAFLLTILTYGMETGFFRFINRKEETKPDRVYATTLFSIAVSSSIFILLAFVFLQPVSDALGYADRPEYLGMMLSVVAVDAFCCIPFAYLRYKRRAIRFASLKLFSIVLNIVLNLFFFLACPWLMSHNPSTVEWFYVPGYGVGYAFVANVFTTAVTFLLLLPDIRPALHFRPNMRLLRRMLKYSFPILILGIAGILNQTADKILFPFLFADREYAQEQLGIYGACFKIAVVMVMFVQAFRYAYEPFVFARHKAGDHRRAYADAMKYFVLIALVIFIGVMFYLDILKYFVTPAYYPGLRVVPIVMLGELFFGIYFNLSFWYKLTDKTHWGAYFSIVGFLITISIIIGFAPTYGYMACAWASLICNAVMMLLSYFFGRQYFPIPYEMKTIGMYSLAAAVVYAAGMLPDITGEAARLIWRTLLLLLFIAAASYHTVRKRERN